MVYVRDVAQVRDGNPPQTNIVHVDGSRSVLMQVLKNGSVSTLAIIDGIKQKVEELKPASAGTTEHRADRRPVACSSSARSAASSAKASSRRR